MAVRAPTAPVPPVAPKVPQVKLEEGGSVTQSTAPPKEGTTSKSVDTEQQLEERAREAVAQGEGGLSRTTQTDPRAEAKQAAKAAEQARQAGRDGASATQQTGAGLARDAADSLAAPEQGQVAGNRALAEQQVANKAQAQTQAGQSFPETLPGGHGALYWGASLAMMAVLAFIVLRYALSRKGRAGELTAADFDDDGDVVDTTLDGGSLRGLKPDEVLARLEAREHRQGGRPAVHSQGTLAQQALHQAARPPHHAGAALAPKASASAQGAKHIAREYRSQALAEAPRRKPRTAPLRPRVQKQEEEAHFEVRV